MASVYTSGMTPTMAAAPIIDPKDYENEMDYLEALRRHEMELQTTPYGLRPGVPGISTGRYKYKRWEKDPRWT